MALDLGKAREVFDDFLMIMDDQIEWLVDQGHSRGIDLDGSLESLDRLEFLYALMSAAMSEDEQGALRVVFARYLGDLVCQHHGGKWTLPLDDPKDINFNMPVIVGHSSCPWLEFNPIHTMRGYSLRPKPGMIRSVVAHSVDPQVLDLSDLVEED
ncbi:MULTISPECIES: hypothetical protein [Stenotrophomonas]|uniref:Uncharacterized protein n=1 Tax=Stenotrophomonas lactitubi TaxID=2045214 RepID=A0AAW4GE88_9GAMM|nr:MULTISPECIES: hypothetical protein [Stenotrophomonas]MBM9912321.1 hypothetical protein [Stenotrophomonas lactitubi]MBM9920641.1 hypothetical protein [Stenotrophomonas lactitubi]MBM9937917.1 hypothetical protein [Stenotrophomonas lactitubi]